MKMKTKTLKEIVNQCYRITLAVVQNPNLSKEQRTERVQALKPLKRRYKKNAREYLQTFNLDPLTSPIPASIYTK